MLSDPRRVIYRYEVPVDDQWHWIPLTGDVLYVAARRVDVVEFWSLEIPDFAGDYRWFRVVGTGQPLPPKRWWSYAGTAIAPGDDLVWHLLYTDLDPAGWSVS